jgi:hypothetical protein
MRNTRVLVFGLVFILAEGTHQKDNLGKAAVSEPKATKATLQEISDAMDKLLKLKAISYHRLLREASLLVPSRLQGQDWADVQKLMKQHRFVVEEAWANGAAVNSYYLVKKGAFGLSKGRSLDLYLFLQAPNLEREGGPDRPGKIERANVVLVADLNVPYSQVAAEKRLPKGSVLEVVLRSNDVREIGAVWPILKKVYVHYDYIGNRWEQFNPRGFHVCVEFAASPTKRIAGKKMYFYIPSGLDPLESWDGKKRLGGFRSKDALGEIISSGGNEWWYGDEKTVEANQRRYLKKKR